MADIARFCAGDHALLAPYGGDTGIVDAELAALNRRRRIRVTVPDIGSLGPAVACSPLLATLPASAARRVAATHGLLLASPPVALPPLRPFLVWRARVHTTPDEVWFREQLLAHLSPPADEG